jgi:predicted ArsR family transcriptional regulator
MTALQHEARALGDPTRHALFRYVAEAGEPTTIAELTAHVGLHHNAVRQHVAKLVGAGLIVETTAPATGRGRPRLQYTVEPGAAGRWGGGVTPYERLSELLAEIIRTGDRPVDVGRRAGVRAAGAVARSGGVARVLDVMAREGFEPESDRHGDRTQVVLAACPFRTAAIADPLTVCAVHLGLAEGLVEGTDVRVTALVPRDPRTAGCLLEIDHLDHVPAV